MKKILTMAVAMIIIFGVVMVVVMVGCGKGKASTQSTEKNVTTIDSTEETTSNDNVIVSPTDSQEAEGIVQIEEIHFEDIGSEHGQCLHSDILKTDKLKVNGDMAGVVYVMEYADGKIKLDINYDEE